MGAAICVAFSLALVAGGGGAGSGGEQALTVPGGPGRFPPGLLGNESLPVGFQKPGRKRAGGCLLHPSLLLQPAQLLELRLPPLLCYQEALAKVSRASSKYYIYSVPERVQRVLRTLLNFLLWEGVKVCFNKD